MNPTVYVETSVLSHLSARPARDVVIAAYQEITQEWWSLASSRFSLVASELVVAEAALGDSDAARARLAVLDTIKLIAITKQTLDLNQKLIDLGAVPRKAADDAPHIATADVINIGYLATWNFRHIANATMRCRIEEACRSSGYEPPVTCTPSKLTESARTSSRGLAMQATKTDPIIEELRSVRDEHAARCGYDVDAMFRDIRARQVTSGREYLRRPAREIVQASVDQPTR